MKEKLTAFSINIIYSNVYFDVCIMIKLLRPLETRSRRLNKMYIMSVPIKEFLISRSGPNVGRTLERYKVKSVTNLFKFESNYRRDRDLWVATRRRKRSTNAKKRALFRHVCLMTGNSGAG